MVENNIDSSKEENIIDSEFEGYLEVPKFNIKRLIKTGGTKSVLDSNYVLYYNSFYNLDKNDTNIILLGHNIESVFRFLHYLEIDDEIILVTRNSCYKFIISNIDIVSENTTEVLSRTFDSKTLTLITCMKNNKNRLILTAKLKNIS